MRESRPREVKVMRDHHYPHELCCLRLQKHLNTTVDSLRETFCDPGPLCRGLEGDWFHSES